MLAITAQGPRVAGRIISVDREEAGARKRWDENRDETEAQRLDRNWSSLLQELRVAQTGVQLLTGFLLILPFQPRFTELDGLMRGIYLVTVACSIGATVLLVAPVSMHRMLFRRHRLKTLVAVSHTYAIVGTALLGIALGGVATIIFDSVLGRTSAWIAGGVTLLALLTIWYVMPLRDRNSGDTSY
jgi:O-antigen/teichoic acid export membrane protein